MRFDPIYLYNLPRQPAYEAQLATRAGQIAANMMKAYGDKGKNRDRSVGAILDRILEARR
jgi:hypothetical protein